LALKLPATVSANLGSKPPTLPFYRIFSGSNFFSSSSTLISSMGSSHYYAANSLLEFIFPASVGIYYSVLSIFELGA
jgi:hypothetical protein